MLLSRLFARRPGLAAGSVAALLGILAASCNRKPPAIVEMPPPGVTVQHPIEETLDDTLNFTGILRAYESVEVRPRVSGFIDKISFQPDSHVKAGDVLFTIDPRPYDAALLKAEAELQGKQANLKAAEVNLTRTKQLVESQSASELELIERTASYDLARAEIATAEANIVTAKLNQDFTRVTAPISGRISRNLVDKGTLVSETNPPLLTTIVNDEKMYAYFTVSESEYTTYVKANPQSRVRNSSENPATPVFLGTNADTGFPYKGKVDAGDNKVDPETGTFEVRAIFDNPDRTLTPGLFVRLRALTGRSKAILVPDTAVQSDQQGRFVAVVKADNTVERRPVKVGALDGNWRRILEGVTAEDQIVTNGLQAARAGAKVNPKLETPEVKLPSQDSTTPTTGPTTGPATAPTNGTPTGFVSEPDSSAPDKGRSSGTSGNTGGNTGGDTTASPSPSPAEGR